MKKKNTSLKTVVVLSFFIILLAALLLWSNKYRSTFNTHFLSQPSPLPRISSGKVPSPVEIPGWWSTYYNQDLDISFRYPPDWDVLVGKDIYGRQANITITCLPTGPFSVYFKHPALCKDQEVIANTITIYDPKSNYNSALYVSAELFGGQMGTHDFFSPEAFHLVNIPVIIKGKEVTETQFQAYAKGIYKGFGLPGIPTGKNSIFSQLHIFASTQPIDNLPDEMDLLQKIAQSMK